MERSVLRNDQWEVIKDLLSGKSTDCGVTHNALAEKINYLLNNPSEWRKILDTGRAHLEDEFDSEKQGKKLAVIYHDLLKESQY